MTQQKPRNSSSGGSAIKQLKKQLHSSGVYEKLKKIGKKTSRKRVVEGVLERKDAKALLATIAKKTMNDNPFEKKVVPQKHEVLGRVIKGAVGRPGQVRARHQQIRENTLSIEMKNRKRENVMMDRRFGENDPTMSTEDKMLERFMREKTKKISAGSLYNLEEEEELTHMGQSLAASGFGEAGLEAVGGDDEDSGLFHSLISRWKY
jgi:nucleolar protein 14